MRRVHAAQKLLIDNIFEKSYKIITKKGEDMDIKLIKATINDAEEIHQMQKKTFKELLDKYQDYDTNPGNESIDIVVRKINHEESDYYIIKSKNISVGAIRIVRLKDENKCKVAPIFILPEYQKKGIAQKVFEIVEEMYEPEKGWILNTILQEKGNCYLSWIPEQLITRMRINTVIARVSVDRLPSL